ncbi:hypothetical protein ACFQGB_22115, partial [Halorubellus litoreus]
MSVDDGSEAARGGRQPGDGAASRPSKNNRQETAEGASDGDFWMRPRDMPDGTARRPLSVEPGRRLRDEAVLGDGDGDRATRSRPWHAVVNAWRRWHRGYLNTHIEFTSDRGETGRTRLQNSYMPEYGKRYYAKVKDFERAADREVDGLTTVMLTFSASNLNAEGHKRCPADHMRDIADGWDTARKQLHQVLSGRNWEYARVWEPHESGYGHQHVAVFVEDGDDLAAEEFAPVMRSYVAECEPAGWEAHDPENDAVSVNDSVENLGSYVSEYIGIFGEEALSRPMK